MEALDIKTLIEAHPRVKTILFNQVKKNIRELQMEMVKESKQEVELHDLDDKVVENYLTVIAEHSIQLLIYIFDFHEVHIVPIYLYSDNWVCTVYSKNKVEYEGKAIYSSRVEAVIGTFPKAFDILEEILNDKKDENDS